MQKIYIYEDAIKLHNFVSLCKNTFEPHFERVSIQKVIVLLKDDPDVKRKTKRIREIISQKGKCKDVTKLKNSLLSFNMGTFKDIKNNANNASFLHTDKLLFDFDNLDDITKAKANLKKMPGTYLVFVSPSGEGIKAVFQLDRCIRDIDDYKQAYMGLAESLKANTGLTPDTTCDPRRLCFLSHDEELFFNPDVKPISIPLKSVPRTPKTLCAKFACSDKDQDIIKIVSSIIRRSKPGYRHNARLKAGHSLGGYIGAGEIEEQKALEALIPIIKRNTDNFTKSIKTFKEAIAKGKKEPRRFIEVSKSSNDLLIPSHISKTDLSTGAKFVYALLTKYSEGGECRPKQETISKSLALSKRSITNHIKELKQKDYIDVIPGNSFNEEANRYFFLK
ncbi:MAG: helix-turn-helix domain-containing protein [Victivallaceae bacterium]|nr:helix-turn-helix domain-containing protein [Victivallaceae bacterium]